MRARKRHRFALLWYVRNSPHISDVIPVELADGCENRRGGFQTRPQARVSLTLIRAKPYGGFADLTMGEHCLSEPA